MGTYTRMTRAWLDRRYRRTTAEGVYLAHQPIYGLGHGACEPGHLPKLARTFQLLQALNRLEFTSLLDVGGSEGCLGHLARELFGAEVLVGDLSAEAARRANELFGLEGTAFDSARLPFRDDSFDVVVCSEVVEHVEFPVDVLLELDRVAGKAVVLSTEEVTADEAQLVEHAAGRRDLPHAERNLFHVRDLRLVFGEDAHFRSQFRGTPPPDTVSLDEARAWIREATAIEEWDASALGVVLVAPRGEGALVEPRRSDEELLDAVLGLSVDPRPPGPEGAVVTPAPDRAAHRERMVCCFCTGRLVWPEGDDGELSCANCQKRFPLERGVVSFYDESAPDPSAMDLESHLLIEGDDPDHIDGIMQLYDRLELPDATRELEWSFADEAARSAWTVDGALVDRQAPTNGFHWNATSEDPLLVGPMIALPDASELELVVEMRIHNPDFPADAGEGQVYWMGLGDLSFGEDNSIRFPVVNDGEPHTYRVPVTDHDNWPTDGGLWLRFDPVNGPAEVDLFSIRLAAKDG